MRISEILRKSILTFGLASALVAGAENLVLLHTNDTHSAIDADAEGRGGVLARKALIDSVRKAEKNVILIDAGDGVQGTLYFKYFKGDVEYPLFNMMDYDIRILGNHEFDNGIDELAKYWKGVKGERLSANYDFSDTPAAGLFKPYVIRKAGKKKIGFIGLNIDPSSLIAEESIGGMRYEDALKAANCYAGYLKNKEKCDLVVAVTHIGYTSSNNKLNDQELARQSKDIDIIIGGHSHTFVNPSDEEKTPHWFENADGKRVLVAQTGKHGRYLGYIKIDTDKLDARDYQYACIPVTARYPESDYDPGISSFLKPYRAKVDSLNSIPVAYSYDRLENGRSTGALANWAADISHEIIMDLIDSLNIAGKSLPYPDFSMTNVGGIRQPLPDGIVTEGQIRTMFPFSNHLTLLKMKGADIIETMGIVAPKGGEAVSNALRTVTDDKGRMEQVILNGNPLNPAKEYIVGTIDYIAGGNDDMIPMSRHTLLWRDDLEIGERILNQVRRLSSLGIGIEPDATPRFVENIKYIIADETDDME